MYTKKLLEKNIFLKYKEFLSITDRELLAMYPNNPTPIITLPGSDVWAKLEYCSFSNSIKDREVFMEFVMAKKNNFKGIVVASTGNMGVALASICALYQYHCYVFTPTDTSKVKLKQILDLGANLFKIDGNYDQTLPKAVKFSKKNKLFLASLQDCRFDGYKTVSYEIYDHFKKNLPEKIIIPLGDGTTYVGIYRGFEDLKVKGLIKKIPKLIGVQANNCSPIVKAFKEKKSIKSCEQPETIAKAIRIGNPYDGNESINIAKMCHGDMFSYSDKQILTAYEALLKKGINSEYASAITYCPVLFEGINNCLLLITGSGFKN
ncbi:MAG: pyridoxal-phosphate dependent enzyme [Candidatus Shapirobacteria bacterium]|nr:pyridoxal-phosphate dependent enzyme [Candidatus Shapirobacteria bacterium]MDD4410588.1 pyridoxal-phosphate dependent enzyme [Candidatus Shapirobacteria bacterium]